MSPLAPLLRQTWIRYGLASVVALGTDVGLFMLFLRLGFGPVAAWNDVAHDPETGIVTYGTHYEIRATGKRLSAASRIAFPEKAELEAQIAEAGLRVTRWLGDWDGNAWQPGARELIPVGTLA